MLSYEHWQLIFMGMVGMIMLFTGMQFYQMRSRIYGYYFLYMLFWLIYFYLRNHLFGQSLNEFARVGPPMAAYIMYFLFAILLIDFKTLQPQVYKALIITCYYLFGYIIFDFILCFIFKAFTIHEFIHNLVRFYLIVFSIYGISKVFNVNNKLTVYFLIGSFMVVAGSATAMILSIIKLDDYVFEPLFYMQVGIVLELLCFSLGLGYRQKLITEEKAMVEQALIVERKQHHIEKLEAIIETQQNERRRVASELHDDLGPGLTTIRFLAEKISIDVNKNTVFNDLSIISKKSSELIDNMQHIIWMMNKTSIKLDELVSYIRAYSFQYLDENNLSLIFNCPEEIPVINLTNDQRRNIFLSIKECLHNIVKHSLTKSVEIQISINQILEIIIVDFGQGFLMSEKEKSGNGLKNMKNRMNSINCQMEINSSIGDGTIIKFILDLMKLKDF